MLYYKLIQPIMALSTITLLVLLSLPSSATKPIALDPSYNHDKFVTLPGDEIKQFRAFTVSMDTKDNDDKYGEGEATGTPEWVAYEIKKYEGQCIPTKSRPTWKSERKYVESGIAPNDDSYKYSKDFRKAHSDWYVRGHLQMKLIAARMGHDAADNTHTFLNAVPQRSKFNSGIWLDLEYITAAWAQKYNAVWVITGPIYIDELASGYLGENDEFKVSIPDALFKIVAKESQDSDTPDVLAFIYPQVSAGYFTKNYDHSRYLTNVDEIEMLTGLNFLSTLPKNIEKKIEATMASKIWPYSKKHMIPACKKQ